MSLLLFVWPPSLRSRRLELVGVRDNGRAWRRRARGEGALPSRVSFSRARVFLRPLLQRLLRRQLTTHHGYPSVCLLFRNYRLIWTQGEILGFNTDNLLSICEIGSVNLHVPTHNSRWRSGGKSSGRRQDYYLWPWLEPQHGHTGTWTSLENWPKEACHYISPDHYWYNRGEDLS